MKKTRSLVPAGWLAGWLLVPFAGCGGAAVSTETAQAADARAAEKPAAERSAATGVALAARKRSAEEGKYLFVFFWKSGDENASAMRKLFDGAMSKAADRANTVAVDIADPAEKAIVDEYGLARAPMPLVLAIAPNGAITGGFPTRFTEEELLSAFATPATQRCMKLLQDGKLVFLCVQNAKTRMNGEAMQGVKDFAADERYRAAAEIVTLDPSDGAEERFLKDLQIDPATKTAVTMFLVPPGSPVALFEGATTKEQLVAELQKAGSCCPGGACGPGGCK